MHARSPCFPDFNYHIVRDLKRFKRHGLNRRHQRQRYRHNNPSDHCISPYDEGHFYACRGQWLLIWINRAGGAQQPQFAAYRRPARRQLFPKNMVFASVAQRRIQWDELTEYDTVVALKRDLPAVIDDIRRVLPLTKTMAS